MKAHNVTIKDIARELGVSPSTVSRAIKDHPDISTETKKQVKELVEKLKYKPNAVALSLRSRKTNMIGVIVPQIVHHFFSSVISGIEETAMAGGYNVMIFQSNESYDREVLNVQGLINSRVDGALVSISKESKKFGHFRELIENETPLVFFDRAPEEIEADKVVVDDFAGAFDATEYLIKTGCRRIAHFAAPQHLQIGYKRQRGYISALEKNGIVVDDDLIVKCDTLDEALVITPKIMSLPNPPEAIFTVNDLTAAGVLKALKKLGLKVPEDVSVIGFTDGLVSTVTDPALSTISQHGFDLGKTAAGILLKRISSGIEITDPVTEVLKTNLVIRESTRLIL
ncbi:MAG: LacI family transcriptional regulator [Bacteroidales bacterium]|nr:LacI family transcriptional regulator [Bacteroidales bacterium]MCF8390649.1 LacI family transcriptional regulator [Bacteroidales bacterium]